MSKRYTFLDIYKKNLDLNKDTKVKINQIVIPKIQRPYAQGRQDGVCTYVRNTLLKEMFENFQTDEIFDFNFIYGIVRPANDSYVMELLDGQQRMTTLFLLYWYVANRELSEGNEVDTEIRDALGRFVYETRSTSTVFCQRLASYRVDLKSEPSKAITKAKWYFKSFDRDSTICAMLTMLDAIHEKYNNQDNHELYKKLGNIQFYVKSLGYFNLSEELYIKMNARGLQLSPFENFKADLINFINNKEYAPYKATVPLYKKESEDVVGFDFNFAVKIDAKWIDIFWKKGFENFDAAYMSFFSRFFACKYIVATKDVVSDRDMRQDQILRQIYTDAENRNEVNEYLGFQEFEHLLNEHPEYVCTLDKVLDAFYEYDLKDDRKLIYNSMLPLWEKKNPEDGDDFYNNLSSKMTHTKLIVFGAVIEFIEAYETFDVDAFKQWMRVVWNIVENTNIDSLTPVSSLIRKFSAVIHYTARKAAERVPFYEALAKWKEDNSEDREIRALVEEVEKAKRIAEDRIWLDTFTIAEKHPFFKGMVLFFYEPGLSIEKYQHRYQLAKDMFDESGISVTYRKDHLLIRAIVSQFNSWNDLDEKYITERSETNKYLKNILASHDGVRVMFAELLDQSDEFSVKNRLREYIDEEKELVSKNGGCDEYCDMAVNRLRKDIKLYDWIANKEKNKSVFRVYEYEGHIMFAIPRKQYDKVALDTERAKTACKIAENYGFSFNDVNQADMFKQYKDCFGNEIWLKQERQKCSIWVGFCQHHEIWIQIECQTKKYAKELLEVLEDSSYVGDNERLIQIPSLEHFKYLKTYNALAKVLEQLFEVIPEK